MRSEKDPSVIYHYLPRPSFQSRRHQRSVPSYVPTPLTFSEWVRSFWRYRLRPFIARWTRRAVLVGLGFSVGWKGKEFDRPAVPRANAPVAPAKPGRPGQGPEGGKGEKAAARRQTPASALEQSGGAPPKESVLTLG
jgi:hypothetical protein